MLFSVSAGADEWKGWRGLEKQCVGDSVPVPVHWSATTNVAWKTEIPGEGYSSPVVDANNVYVTAAEISRKNMNLSFVIVILITLLAIGFILKQAYSSIKEKDLPLRLSNLSLIATYGLFLFAFLIMFWMFMGERTLHKIFINYLFSGALVLLCIIMTTIDRKRSSSYKIVVAILIGGLTFLLLKNRPSPDYFAIKEFFSRANVWLFPVSISCLFLPVLVSIYLLLREIYRFLKPTANVAGNESTGKKLRFHRSALPFTFIIAGLGFFSIPVISLLKLYVVDAEGMRIRPTITPALLVDPEFAFPFFLAFLSLGFLFWLILFSQPGTIRKTTRFSPFMVLLPLSILFFVMLNYSKSGPEYLRVIYCLDRNTGKIKWKQESLAGPAIKISNYNSQATPTALVDNKSVYAYFGSAGMFSTDLNGELRWENKNLPFESNHGIGTSPIFCDSRIIILNSMTKDSYLTALNKETGLPEWKNNLPSANLGEYRTPVLYKDYILEWSGVRKEIVLYKKNTGQIAHRIYARWERAGEAVTTPLIINDMVILADVETIAGVDLNKLCTGEGDPFIWQTTLGSKGPETSSPVFANGLIFMISDNGFASCVDFSSGKIIWQKRLRGSFLSSPIISGNKVYFSNNAGVTTVLECSSEYKSVAENNLQEGIYATLAPVNGQLFIRTKSTLWCISE